MSDIDTAAADSLKVLDPERPIREADMNRQARLAGSVKNDPTAKSAEVVKRQRCRLGDDLLRLVSRPSVYRSSLSCFDYKLPWQVEADC